jgi:hypothetical protein
MIKRIKLSKEDVGFLERHASISSEFDHSEGGETTRYYHNDLWFKFIDHNKRIFEILTIDEVPLNLVEFSRKNRNTYSEKIAELEKELKVTKELLADRQKLLDAIPECPVHGKCVPNALLWIECKKQYK